MIKQFRKKHLKLNVNILAILGLIASTYAFADANDWSLNILNSTDNQIQINVSTYYCFFGNEPLYTPQNIPAHTRRSVHIYENDYFEVGCDTATYPYIKKDVTFFVNNDLVQGVLGSVPKVYTE